jgi:hypothetical protein
MHSLPPPVEVWEKAGPTQPKTTNRKTIRTRRYRPTRRLMSLKRGSFSTFFQAGFLSMTNFGS